MPQTAPDTLLDVLLSRHGPLLRTEDVLRYTGHATTNALRMAVARGTVGFEVIAIPGRRGRFARAQDVAAWLASHGIESI